MSTFSLKRRIDRLAAVSAPDQAVFSVVVKNADPVTVPDEFKPDHDILITNVVVGMDAKPLGGSVNLLWRGAPLNLRAKLP